MNVKILVHVGINIPPTAEMDHHFAAIKYRWKKIHTDYRIMQLGGGNVLYMITCTIQSKNVCSNVTPADHDIVYDLSNEQVKMFPTPIDMGQLNKRAQKVIKKLDIKTVGQLYCRGEFYLLETPYCGFDTVLRLKFLLEKCDLALPWMVTSIHRGLYPPFALLHQEFNHAELSSSAQKNLSRLKIKNLGDYLMRPPSLFLKNRKHDVIDELDQYVWRYGLGRTPREYEMAP